MGHPGDAQELLAAVRARTEGTPYVVTETGDGFEVHIDIADASWYAVAYKEHVSMTWTYAVKVDVATKTLSITDIGRSVTWRAGAESRDGIPTPVLSASASTFRGRVEGKGFRKVYAFNERGEYGKVLDVSFGPAEGRELVRGPARELGWTEKRGVAERIGRFFAMFTLVGILLGGIATAILLAVMALNGDL